MEPSLLFLGAFLGALASILPAMKPQRLYEGVIRMCGGVFGGLIGAIAVSGAELLPMSLAFMAMAGYVSGDLFVRIACDPAA